MVVKAHLLEHSSMPADSSSAKTDALVELLESDEQFDTQQAFVNANLWQPGPARASVGRRAERARESRTRRTPREKRRPLGLAGVILDV